jgi:hypothetical protein
VRRLPGDRRLVVALEAVEVEEQEHRVSAAGPAALEVGEEPPAVRQAGQRVACRRGRELASRGAQGHACERHEREREREHGRRRGTEVAQEPCRRVARGGYEDPVVGVACPRAHAPVAHDAAGGRSHAGSRGRPGELRESAIARRTQRGANPLRARTVDDHASRSGVDDREIVVAVVGPQLAPEALYGQLVVHDGHRRAAGAERDRRGVADHPVVGVGRHVRLRLEDLTCAQSECRAEERVVRLVGREVRHRRSLAVHDAGILRAAAVDEAQLADLAGEQAFQVGQRLVGRVDVGRSGAQLRRAAAGLEVEAAEGRVVRHDQRDRPRARQGRLERGGVRAGLVVQRTLGRGLMAVVVVDRHPQAQRKQGDREN